MKDYDSIIKRCTECLSKLEISNNEEEKSSEMDDNGLAAISSNSIARTIKEHKSFVENYKKSDVNSLTINREILEMLPPVWDENLIGDYVEQVVGHFLETGSMPEKKKSNLKNKPIPQKKDEAVLVTNEDFPNEFPIKWKKVPQEDKKQDPNKVKKTKIVTLKDVQKVPTLTAANKKLETRKEIKKPKLEERIGKGNPIRSEENLSGKREKTAEKIVSPKMSKADPKSYKARHMRFLGSKSSKVVDFSKEHPNLVLGNSSNAEKTLFPRRQEKSDIIVEEYKAEEKEDMKDSLNESATIENEIENVRSTTTWHDLLSQKVQTVLFQRKVLKYSRKNENEFNKPLEVNKDSERIYDVIYDSPRCKKSNERNCSNKLSVQNMPILCIRGECKVQKTVNISIQDHLEKGDSDGEFSNVRYYQFSHAKQETEVKKVDNRKCPKDVEIQVDDMTVTREVDVNLKEPLGFEAGFNKYKAPFQTDETIIQSTTNHNGVEQSTSLPSISNISNRITSIPTTEEEKLQKSLSGKLNRSISSSSSESVNTGYSESFESPVSNKYSEDNEYDDYIDKNLPKRSTEKTFVIASSNDNDNNSFSSRIVNKKRNLHKKNISSRTSSPSISVEHNKKGSNLNINNVPTDKIIKVTSTGVDCGELIRLTETSAQTDEVKSVTPRIDHCYPSIVVECDNRACSPIFFENDNERQKCNEESQTSSRLKEFQIQCEIGTNPMKEKSPSLERSKEEILKEIYKKNEPITNDIPESKTDKTFIINSSKGTQVTQRRSIECQTMDNVNSDYKCDDVNNTSNKNNNYYNSGDDEASNISIPIESNQENRKKIVTKGNEMQQTLFVSSENSNSRLCVPKRFYNEKNKGKSNERQRQTNYRVDDNDDATNKFSLNLNDSSFYITTSSSGMENDNYKFRRCICSYHRQYQNNSNTSVKEEQVFNESKRSNLDKSTKEDDNSQQEPINDNIYSDLDETSNSHKMFSAISRGYIRRNDAATRDELKKSYYRSQILLNNSLDLSPKFSNTLNKIYSGATKKSFIQSKRTDPEVKRAVQRFLKSLSLNSNHVHFKDKNEKSGLKKKSNTILLEENACLRRFHNLISNDGDDDDDDVDNNDANDNFDAKDTDRTITVAEQNRYNFEIPNVSNLSDDSKLLSESNEVSENSESFTIPLKIPLSQSSITPGTSTRSDRSNKSFHASAKRNLNLKRAEGHKAQTDKELNSQEYTSLSDGEILSLGEVKNIK